LTDAVVEWLASESRLGAGRCVVKVEGFELGGGIAVSV
jgi:hypothetical protein